MTVASKLKITPEALILDLIDDGLRRRAARMIENMPELDSSELDQLFAILKLVSAHTADVSEPRAVATGSSGAGDSKRRAGDR